MLGGLLAEEEGLLFRGLLAEGEGLLVRGLLAEGGIIRRSTREGERKIGAIYCVKRFQGCFFFSAQNAEHYLYSDHIRLKIKDRTTQ